MVSNIQRRRRRRTRLLFVGSAIFLAALAAVWALASMAPALASAASQQGNPEQAIRYQEVHYFFTRDFFTLKSLCWNLRDAQVDPAKKAKYFAEILEEGPKETEPGMEWSRQDQDLWSGSYFAALYEQGEQARAVELAQAYLPALQDALSYLPLMEAIAAAPAAAQEERAQAALLAQEVLAREELWDLSSQYAQAERQIFQKAAMLAA